MLPWVNFMLPWVNIILPWVNFILPWINLILPWVNLILPWLFTFAVTLVDHRTYVLTINVSTSVNIKYKSYFKISIIENAICLSAKRVIHLERFPWLWTFPFHIECILPNISDCPVCKQQRWQMLNFLEGLGKTANIDTVCSGDSLWRGRKRRINWGSRGEKVFSGRKQISRT
jgi:hypothetical protein